MTSENPNQVNSRWLWACVLLCAVVVLPLGVALAQDYRAVEKRLGRAVAEGELSLKQAGIMMDALKGAGKKDRDDKGDTERRFGEWIGSVGEKLKAAVKADKLSEEDAWAKWRHFKEHELAPKLKATVKASKMSEEKGWAIWRGVELAETGEKLKAAVAAGKITEEQARAKWEAIAKEAKHGTRGGDHHARAEAHFGEVWAKLQAAVKAGKMSKEDAHKKMAAIKKDVAARMRGDRDKDHHDRGRDKRSDADGGIEGHFKKLGVTNETVGKIRRRLAENGIKREQINPVLGGMLRVIHGMRSQGERFKLDPRLRDYFKKRIRLTDKQVELVRGISRRVLHGMQQRGDKNISREDLERAGIKIRKAVAAGKITKEQGRAKMDAMRKMMGRQSEHGARKPSRRKLTPKDWPNIKKRIEGAVKRGDMTREQADAKYKEIKERMGEHHKR